MCCVVITTEIDYSYATGGHADPHNFKKAAYPDIWLTF